MPARTERSAGVVCFREGAGGPGGRAFLVLDHGSHRDFPKGHLERGESDRDAALRELGEETGIGPGDVELVDGFAREIGYYFRDHKKRLVKKTVAFFLGRTTATEVRVSDEHVGGSFLPADEALAAVTHAGPREVLRAAIEFLDGGGAGGTAASP